MPEVITECWSTEGMRSGTLHNRIPFTSECPIDVSLMASAPTDVIPSYSKNNLAKRNAWASYDIYIKVAISLLGITGNGLVVCALGGSKELRSKSVNVLIINQSMLDLVASLLLAITAKIIVMGAPHGLQGIQADFFCKLWVSKPLLWGLFLSSTYNLVALTLDRYIRIVHPLWQQASFTGKHTKGMVIFVWVFGISVEMFKKVVKFGSKQGRCTVNPLFPIKGWFDGLGVVIAYILPLVFMLFAYSSMAFALIVGGQAGEGGVLSSTEQAREKKMSRAKGNILKTLCTVTICYLICWTPNVVFYTLYSLGYPVQLNTPLHSITVYLVFCNCCVNPIIYAIQYDQFKGRVRELICRHQSHQHTNRRQ